MCPPNRPCAVQHIEDLVASQAGGPTAFCIFSMPKIGWSGSPPVLFILSWATAQALERKRICGGERGPLPPPACFARPKPIDHARCSSRSSFVDYSKKADQDEVSNYYMLLELMWATVGDAGFDLALTTRV